MNEVPDRIRVLHVDDEPDFADLTAAFLEREDDRFEVETATGADEGLTRLSDEEFDCVVSDYDMPGQNGIRFLEAVREGHPDLPFILFTGKGSEEVASDAISAGVSDYLQKESGTDQYALLANRITNLVSQYRAVATVEEYASQREESEQYRQQLLEIISDPDSSESEKAERLLALGRERLGVENGHLVIVDEDADRHEVVGVSGSDVIREGVTDLSETYCRKTIESDERLAVHDASEQGWADDPAYRAFGLECYIGGKVTADSLLLGTLCFVDTESRDPFTAHEKAFFDLLVRWFSQMLERRRRLNQADAIFEHTQDALFLIDVTDDRRFTVRSVNRAYSELTGYATADIRGQTPRELLGDEQGGEVEARYRECVERREPIEYDERLALDDTTRYWHTRLAPVVEDDRVVQLVGATRDVTEQRQRERELEAMNRRLEAILDNTTTPMFMKDADGRYVFVNHGYRELFDIHGETVTGRTDHDLHPPEVAEEVWENDRAVVESGDPLEVEERVVVDGEERVFLSSKVPVYDTGERSDPDDPVAVFGVASDVTDLRRRKEQLQRERDRLDEFTSVVSHDIRSPLNVAEGHLELAREDCDSEHIEPIDRALSRIKELIDDLLTLAREGDRVRETEPVALAELSQTCWGNVATSDARIRISLDRTVRADRSRFQQLLENLFRNAIEHSSGDVTVTVGELPGGFYVEDDGPGIPEEDRGDVFEAGYSTAEDGTGFGLSIVKQVADAHGWDVRVTDGSEGGARFEVTDVEFAAG